jgi:hypothetical protein
MVIGVSQSTPSRANELGLGLRIMTFGVLFDFTGNSNVSKVIKAADLVKQQWFLDAVNFSEPVDLFLLIGHNPIRGLEALSVSSMTPSDLCARMCQFKDSVDTHTSETSRYMMTRAPLLSLVCLV